MKQAGFTLIEILIVIAIIGVLSAVILVAINPRKLMDETHFAQAKEHLTLLNNTMEAYLTLHEVWPADVDRGIPSALIEELKTGDWPNTPWGPPSSYDWDNIYIADTGEQYYQFSIRFCELGDPTSCKFPELEWAKDFDYYSSVFYCMYGPCRAHRDRPIDHPAYCVNCTVKEIPAP